MTKNTHRSKHVASLANATPRFESKLGYIRAVTVDELPILRNLSIKKLVLAPGAIREPHWHANANEMTYCLRGELLVSILDTNSSFSSFTLSPGEMFYVESGSLHHIENVGNDEAECIVTFRHEKPEDFSLQAAFGSMSDTVLGNTYDLPAADWSKVSRDTKPRFLVMRNGKPEIPSTAGLPNPHKFNVEGMQAPTKVPVGEAKTAKSQFWPILDNISMYALRVEENGMREPHWHPETAEMGYVDKGSARMSILDPDGSVDTYTLGPGDMYFIPRAYPHQIEVLGKEEIHFLIFFDQPEPKDIGYRASATALSREVMAATFGVHDSDLPTFPFTPVNRLIVGKYNKLDPVTNGSDV